jgi:hypothetical protein
MDIKREPPQGDRQVLLLVSQEMNIGPQRGIVDDHCQHEESRYAQNEIGEEGLQYGKDEFHYLTALPAVWSEPGDQGALSDASIKDIQQVLSIKSG